MATVAARTSCLAEQGAMGRGSSEGVVIPRLYPEEASGGEGNDRVRNLQNEVEGVKNIMTQNVERILARGENLDHLRNKTEDLEATSEHFKTTSQKVARKFWWKNVKMIVLICVIVFILILFIVLLATGVIPT
ncbi:PREDICTED: vesicle-associated membrane protein 8 [Chrysochloris asiatica]|uniref:Vesicle-associated membrane protein 8 n=1 Tax=Chrysochloris asiatica TaxID=185453 RepID=A0A9B0WTI1_CHRAS|nr:PREDICTED: vesicle-associated membrane protein 8 [Chrysochloris asiatica]